MTTAPAKKKCKLNDNDDVSLPEAPDDNEEVRQLYPHLCSALGLNDGFDPTSPSIQKSMVALLTEIHPLFSTEFDLSLSLEDMQTRINTTLEFPKHQATTPSLTQKNGSM